MRSQLSGNTLFRLFTIKNKSRSDVTIYGNGKPVLLVSVVYLLGVIY